MMRLSLLTALAVITTVSTVTAQSQFPPPANPVLVCGTQTAPAADTYLLTFDGGLAEPVALAEPADARCPTGSTRSVELPAARFTVGQHTLQFTAVNDFGATEGPVYIVTVGIAPGPFTITAVVAQ